jgi:hypothetical protein
MALRRINGGVLDRLGFDGRFGGYMAFVVFYYILYIIIYIT